MSEYVVYLPKSDIIIVKPINNYTKDFVSCYYCEEQEKLFKSKLTFKPKQK